MPRNTVVVLFVVIWSVKRIMAGISWSDAVRLRSLLPRERHTRLIYTTALPLSTTPRIF